MLSSAKDIALHLPASLVLHVVHTLCTTYYRKAICGIAFPLICMASTLLYIFYAVEYFFFQCKIQSEVNKVMEAIVRGMHLLNGHLHFDICIYL